jgi:plasmid maintenance system killer protein
MIKSFEHDGLERLFASSGRDKRGVPPNLARKLLARLEALDSARKLDDLRIDKYEGYDLHPWKGHRDIWSIKLTGNRRILFRWDENTGDAHNVDLWGH